MWRSDSSKTAGFAESQRLLECVHIVMTSGGGTSQGADLEPEVDSPVTTLGPDPTPSLALLWSAVRVPFFGAHPCSRPRLNHKATRDG